MEISAAVVATMLSFGLPFAGEVAFESPGCDDEDAETPCCPLEDNRYILGIEDWNACFSALGELRVPEWVVP